MCKNNRLLSPFFFFWFTVGLFIFWHHDLNTEDFNSINHRKFLPKHNESYSTTWIQSPHKLEQLHKQKRCLLQLDLPYILAFKMATAVGGKPRTRSGILPTLTRISNHPITLTCRCFVMKACFLLFLPFSGQSSRLLRWPQRLLTSRTSIELEARFKVFLRLQETGSCHAFMDPTKWRHRTKWEKVLNDKTE